MPYLFCVCLFVCLFVSLFVCLFLNLKLSPAANYRWRFKG